MPNQPRTAVFVDGENFSPAHAPAIARHAADLGIVELQRVYGNVHLLRGWDEMPGFRLVHSGAGKNATDLLLAVEAMEHALTTDCQTVLIASCDRDFTHLAERLRQRGVTVIGAGGPRASRHFQAACCRFLALDPASGAPIPEPLPQVASPPLPCKMAPAPTDIDELIRSAIRSSGEGPKGILLTSLNGVLRQRRAFRVSDLPEKTWRGYLGARPHLYHLDASGATARVRFLPAGFGQAGAG